MSRTHHYAFTHVTLRQMFDEDPQRLIDALAEQGVSFLERIWIATGEMVKRAQAEVSVLPSDGLAVTSRLVNQNPSVTVVTLPTPIQSPEAYFIAMMIYPPRKKILGVLGGGEGRTRYVTLELGVSPLDGSAYTVLGEWTDGSHVNMGTGPKATLEAFIDGLIVPRGVRAITSPREKK